MDGFSLVILRFGCLMLEKMVPMTIIKKKFTNFLGRHRRNSSRYIYDIPIRMAIA